MNSNLAHNKCRVYKSTSTTFKRKKDSSLCPHTSFATTLVRVFTTIISQFSIFSDLNSLSKIKAKIKGKHASKFHNASNSAGAELLAKFAITEFLLTYNQKQGILFLAIKYLHCNLLFREVESEGSVKPGNPNGL